MLFKETEFLANGIQDGATQHCYGECDFLKKEASAESITYFNDLKPKKDHLYFLVVAMTAGEHWGCFTKGNIFLSADGEVKDISEISAGDRVVSHNGNINKVNIPIEKEFHGDFTKISARCIPDMESTSCHEYRIVKKEQIVCHRDKYKRCTPKTIQNSNICFKVKIQKELPDVITLDVEMPRMDGHNFCRRFRQQPAYDKIPILLFSSMINEALRRKGEALGADDQVTKPELDELIERMEKCVDKLNR